MPGLILGSQKKVYLDDISYIWTCVRPDGTRPVLDSNVETQNDRRSGLPTSRFVNLASEMFQVIARMPVKPAENTVIVTCAADREGLPTKPAVPVVSVEFVFHGILRHQIDFESFEVK